MVVPVIHGLNEVGIPRILENAAKSGAISAAYTLLRLPYAIKDIFIN